MMNEKNNYKIWNMEVGHILDDAEKWWENHGKELMRNRTFSDEKRDQQEALNATNPLHYNYLGGVSGILLGLPWELLTKKEKYKIVKTYILTLKQMEDKLK